MACSNYIGFQTTQRRGLQPLIAADVYSEGQLGVPVLTTEVADGELCVVKEQNAEGFHSHTIQRSQNHHNFQEATAFVALLKDCAKQNDLGKGARIHADILRSGLAKNSHSVANALVAMYSKCGVFAKAQQIFDELPVRDGDSWSALIAGYAQNKRGKEVLNCFKLMQCEGIPPNRATFAYILKACGSEGAIDKGKEIHADIARQGLLEKDVVLGTALIDMYSKCGLLAKAQQVLDQLTVRDVISWSALIAGYALHGCGEEALNCFEQMQCEGLSPNVVTFSCILKACGSIGAIEKGKMLHAKIVKQGLMGKDIVLSNALMDMYVKGGALLNAQQVLDELPVRDVVSWNALITGYAQQGHPEKALNCFKRMQFEGLSPDTVTFSCLLKACGSLGAIDKGKRIHAEIVRHGLFNNNLVLGNALLDMYAKCGVLLKAQEVFDELSVRDVVSWSALIGGYAQHGFGEEALDCFEQMQHEGLSPNAVTLICILKACGNIGAADKGKSVHAEIIRQGLMEKDIVLATALLDMYVKCGALAKAQEVLHELPVRNVDSWSVLIAGYVLHGKGEEAINCFQHMQLEGLFPNAVTLACILKACGSIGAAEEGENLHAEIVRQDLLEKDTVLGCALVDMYAKCGALARARQVHEGLRVRDVVSWSALIAGYAQHGQDEEALICFDWMHREGIIPDTFTFTCILKLCGCIGAADKGEEVCVDIVRQGLLEKGTVLGIALLTMYAKCGSLEKAQEVVDKLLVRDVVSWSTLISGYAQHGHGEEALNCFERMLQEGLSPDAVTFGCVLNACSHSGLLDEGQMYFAIMRKKYGIIPNLEHYTCMVDLYGRVGHFGNAVAVIDKMPSSDCLLVWVALLGACRKWGNLRLGKLAFEHAVQLDEKDAAAYVCMSNIYAASGLQEDANKVEAMQVKNEAWKLPSPNYCTGVRGNVYSLCFGNARNHQTL